MTVCDSLGFVTCTRHRLGNLILFFGLSGTGASEGHMDKTGSVRTQINQKRFSLKVQGAFWLVNACVWMCVNIVNVYILSVWKDFLLRSFPCEAPDTNET